MKLKSFSNYITEGMKKNNKPKLSPADEKFIAKFISDKLDFDTKKITRSNQFSGEEVELDPICAAVFDFVIELEKAMNASNIEEHKERNIKRVHPDLTLGNCIQNFDRARFIVMKMNPDAYYALLD
jgi:hypothetical protein